jgi:hypothetical protein
MKTRETTPGKTYSVHTSSGCTVSDKNGWQKTIDAPDGYFTAHAGEVTIDGDDAADIREVFKSAPQQKLALLGVLGGNDGLPTGYTRLAYLESNGNQVIKCEYLFTQQTGLYVKSFAIYGNRQAMGTSYVSVPCIRCHNYSPQEISATWNKYNLVLLKPLPRIVIVEGWINWKNSKTARAVSELGEQIVDLEGISDGGKIDLFKAGSIWYGKIFNAAISEDGSIVRQYIPALDPTGAPCMFDTVTRNPFYNSGSGAFIAGIDTTAQLNNMLHKLPDRTGQDVGTLQVRLAEALQTEANLAALDAMVAKNWEISQAA